MVLDNTLFDPVETFKLVYDVFEPQTWTKNNIIVFRGSTTNKTTDSNLLIKDSPKH